MAKKQSPSINNNIDLLKLFSEGYEIGELGETYWSVYGENTRFVILEKYPEKGTPTILNITFQMEKPNSILELDFKIINTPTIKNKKSKKNVQKQTRRRKRI